MNKRRTLAIGSTEVRCTVEELLQRHWGLGRAAEQRLLRAGGVRLDGRPCRNPQQRVRHGQRLEVVPLPQEPRKPGRTPATGLRRRDAVESILGVEKPAGWTTLRHAG